MQAYPTESAALASFSVLAAVHDSLQVLHAARAGTVSPARPAAAGHSALLFETWWNDGEAFRPDRYRRVLHLSLPPSICFILFFLLYKDV